MLASDRLIRRFEEYQGAPLTDAEKAELQRLNAVFDIKDDDIAWSAVVALMVSSSMLTRVDQSARRNLEALTGLLDKARAESQNAMLRAKSKVAEIEEAALTRMEERVGKLMQPVEDRSELVNGLYAERLAAFASRIDDAMEHVYQAGSVLTQVAAQGAQKIEQSAAASVGEMQRAADSFSLVVDQATAVIERAHEAALDITARRTKILVVGAILAGGILVALGILIGTTLATLSVAPR